MEAIINIPLVDVLSKMLEKRVVMSGDKYVELDGVKEIPQDIVDLAIIEKAKLEKKMSVPNSVTKLQAKLQLLEIGLLDEVEVLVEQDIKVKLYWKDASNFYRSDEILLGMAIALGLNDEQLDDLFLQASKL